MEMIRSRETLKECLSLSEGWEAVDIVRAAAREGYGFDPTTGIPSQVGVAHAAGMLVDFERGDRPKRQQRSPRGMVDIEERQCPDDSVHPAHEWIDGSMANGKNVQCRGWDAKTVAAAEAALGDVHEQILEALPSTPVAVEETDGPSELTDEEFDELDDDQREAWVAQRMRAEGLGALVPVGFGETLPEDEDGAPYQPEGGETPHNELLARDEAMPEGWFPFGTHAGPEHAGIRLVFSDETDEVGDPFWEKPYEGFAGLAVDAPEGNARHGQPIRSLVPNDEVDSAPYDHDAAIMAGIAGLGTLTVTATQTPTDVPTVENELTGDGAPFIPEIEQLILWASRWEPEIPGSAQSVRILAEGLLSATRDLHGAIQHWTSTVMRQRMAEQVDRLKAAYESALAELMAMPEPEDASRPEIAAVNDRSQPLPELHLRRPGERRGDPGVADAPRPVLLGQARPVSVSPRRPYKPSQSQRMLDDLRNNHRIAQQTVRAWCVSNGHASGRGGLSVDAILRYMEAHQIARTV
jgi:hypothetical protein